MQLKDVESVWGIVSTDLETDSKVYRLHLAMLYLLEAIVALLLTVILYVVGLSYQDYGYMVVFACIVLYYFGSRYLEIDKWEAFKFYRKFYYDKVSIESFDLNADNLYSILYCCSVKRLRVGKSFDVYKEIYLSSCYNSMEFSSRSMKYMDKYLGGSVKCLILKHGTKRYFVDVYNEGVNYGIDDEGDFTESEG